MEHVSAKRTDDGSQVAGGRRAWALSAGGGGWAGRAGWRCATGLCQYASGHTGTEGAQHASGTARAAAPCPC